MTAFIDSHAHLADPAFDSDRDAAVERARLTGARAVICVGESIAAAERAASLAAAHPRLVLFSAGGGPRRRGPAAVFSVGESIPAAERAASLAAAHPGFVFFTAGVHPHDGADF